MDFTNNFSVNAPLERVWEFILKADQVTPCVPGAQITESIDDLHHKGLVKFKLGPVAMTYRGELEVQPDRASGSITLRAKGKEIRGIGGASGTVTTRLVEKDDGGTLVEIVSKVEVSGKVAQFGRGIMQDVANRMTRQFAECLEEKLQQSEDLA
jgi:uncharacterized protein